MIGPENSVVVPSIFKVIMVGILINRNLMSSDLQFPFGNKSRELLLWHRLSGCISEKEDRTNALFRLYG
jgi:hypothetical protein